MTGVRSLSVLAALVAALVVALPIGSPAAAQGAPAPAAPTTPAAGAPARAPAGFEQAYKIAPGDKLQITVFGQPELTGEFPVDGTGAIVMPLIGVQRVAGLTIDAGGKLIADKLAEGFLNQPIVTVRFVDMRSIYMLGDLRTPGAFPYRPGLSVLGAIALAGGYGWSGANASAAAADALTAVERLRTLQSQHQRLLVHLSRLKAEASGAKTFDPPKPEPGIDEAEAAAIVNAEQEQLRVQVSRIEESVELLRKQKPRLEAEAVAIRTQIEAMKKQLDINQQLLAEYTKLQKNGLGRVTFGLDLHRDEARVQGELSRLDADLARIDLQVGDIDIRIQEATSANALRVATDVAESSAKLREAEASLASAKEIYSVRIMAAPVGTGANLFEQRHVIRLTRSNGTVLQSPQLENTMLVEPGDIIEVQRLLPDSLKIGDAVKPAAPPKRAEAVPAAPEKAAAARPTPTPVESAPAKAPPAVKTKARPHT